MSAFAAVMTGRGTGAISTIEVFGDDAGAVIRKIFKPAGGESADFKAGGILLGTIADGAETIDQVTIGCEGQNEFAVNCHGNPLIVEMIMELLARHQVELITAEELMAKTLAAREDNTIAVEARLVQAKARTIEGTRIILNQIDAGLSRMVKEWLDPMEELSLGQIKDHAGAILEDSRKASLIIFGCRAVIAGPPNTGKSTLLNYLCGKQKAIVTDIKGTTRDWVSARCRIGPLSVELIDTAGLDEEIAKGSESGIETASRKKAFEVLESADLVLLVLDNSQSEMELEQRLLERIAGKRVLTVLNKSDLLARFDGTKLPRTLANTVQTSAKLGTGIENVLKRIPEVCGVSDFDSGSTVCFTPRQENLLRELQRTKSKEQARSVISELLNGRLDV